MKNSKFKIFGLIAIICIVICCAFAGCLSTADYEAIYNDDTKIASSSSNTRIGSVSTSSKGGYKLSCVSLSGVYVINNNFSVNDKTSVNLSLETQSGKCKIVLVSGKNVYTVAESQYDGRLDLSNIPNGKYKLKIAGVEAEFKLQLTY